MTTDTNYIAWMPDEIKIYIFQYLNGMDKINVSQVCKDFQRLSADVHILRRLNFKRDVCFKWPSVAGHLPKSSMDKVTHLNLDGIFWIPSVQMTSIVLRFKNLVSLRIVHVNLPYANLFKIISSCRHLKKLAFSAVAPTKNEALILPASQLTHIYISFVSVSVPFIVRLLSNYRTLEELWICEPKILQDSQNTVCRMLVGTFNLPTVTKRLVLLHSMRGYNFQFDIVSDGDVVTFVDQRNPQFVVKETFAAGRGRFSAKQRETCDEDWLSQLDCASIVGLADTREMVANNLTHKDMRFSSVRVLPSSYPVTGDERLQGTERLRDVLLANNMRFLHTIRIDTTVLSGNKQVTPQSSAERKRSRTQHWTVERNDLLESVTQHCPDVRHFELVNTEQLTGIVPSSWSFQSDCLLSVSNWKVLRTLVLTSVTYQNGKFLTEVLQNCTLLETLKIKDDCAVDKVSGALCKGLQHARNLKHFRYERCYGMPLNDVFKALAHCESLKRVYVQYDDVCDIDVAALRDSLFTPRRLIFFVMYVRCMPVRTGMQLRASLFPCLTRTKNSDGHFYQVYGKEFNPVDIRKYGICMFDMEEMLFQHLHNHERLDLNF